jgi:hypothetical protein
VIDEPNLAEWSLSAMQKYIQQYRTDGFCVVPGLVAPSVCKQALGDIDALVASQLTALKLRPAKFRNDQTLHANMQKLFNANVDAYLAAVRQSNKLLSIQDLLFQERIRRFIKKLDLSLPSIPTAPVVSIMSEKLKIEGGYFGLAPHQDWPSIQGSLDAVVVWAPLMDVTEVRFPLQVIPGSHSRGMWNGNNTAAAREIDPSLYRDEDFKSVELCRGDVIFMTTFTVHRTGVSHDGEECSGLRIACNTRVENSAEKSFVKRKFPCAYKRTVERDLITKGFPSRAQVKKALSA